MMTDAVLYTESSSPSLSTDLFSHRIDGKEPLRWMYERLSNSQPLGDFIVVVHNESDVQRLQATCYGLPIRIIQTCRYTKIETLLDPGLFRGDRVFLLEPVTALAPIDLLEQLAVVHHNNGHDYTIAAGLPPGTRASIVSSRLLSSLAQFAVASGNGDPDLIMELLSRWTSVTGMAPPFEFTAGWFDARKHYGLTPSLLPPYVRHASSRDWALIDRAIQSNGDGSFQQFRKASLLYETKRCMIEDEKHCRIVRKIFTVPKELGREKRILFISTASAYSGAEASLCTLVEQLDRERFRAFALIARDGMFAQRLRRSGVEVFHSDYGKGSANIPEVAFLTDLILRVRPDVIHLNALESINVHTIAKLSGIPCVQHIRNGDLTNFEETILSSDALIAVSQFLSEESCSFAVDADKVRIIYDEVDTSYFDPKSHERQSVRAELDLPETAKVILMIARVAPNKRHDLLLHAVAQVARMHPELHLVLKSDTMSDTLLKGQIESLIETLGLSKRIVWLDFVDDIRRLFIAADVLVLCSEREGLGRCVVEALAMEVPVVVTDSGGSHEIIDSGHSGGIVVGMDVDEIAGAIDSLLNDAELRNTLGKRGREFARRTLEASTIARQVERVYDELTFTHNQANIVAPSPVEVSLIGEAAHGA